jgi:DNA (cytosine-5)-methyltransferase 1
MADSRAVKIGTDCSGMEAPIQAIKNLKVNYKHKFSCDINAHARATIEANFPHDKMYIDLTKRKNSEAPYVDVYVAGFPCQPFSTAGLQQGFGDKKKRGKIFHKVLDYIETQRPRVFILENVSGLKKISGGKYLKAIRKELENLGDYKLYENILDTKQHGIPHSRRRWYCIGIQEDFDNGTFKFPEKIPCPSINKFLERKSTKAIDTNLPPKSQGTARANVMKHLRKLKRSDSDPLKEPFIIDCDSSADRSKFVKDATPCITVSRGAGHWVTSRGRRLLKAEMMRLQGMNPTEFKVAISEAQLGKQLGNTMSVNVLERIFVRLLPAAKLVRVNDVKDRWQSGEALKKLSATRGRGFKKMAARALQARSVTPPPSRSLKRTASSPSSRSLKRQRSSS